MHAVRGEFDVRPFCETELSHVYGEYIFYFFISVSFQDLGSSDLRKDVYIVVHIIRIGTANDATVRTT